MLEVVGVQGMNQVIRGLDAVERCGQRRRIIDVAEDSCSCSVVVVRVPRHRPDVVSGVGQGCAEMGPDKTGGTRDEH